MDIENLKKCAHAYMSTLDDTMMGHDGRTQRGIAKTYLREFFNFIAVDEIMQNEEFRNLAIQKNSLQNKMTAMIEKNKSKYNIE